MDATSDREIVSTLTGMLDWIVEDWSEAILPVLIADMLEAAHANPTMPLREVLAHIALDYSK